MHAPTISQHCREMKDNTHLVEFDDVGVVQQLHNLHLSVNLLQVGGVQSGLVNNLDGHLEKQKPNLNEKKKNQRLQTFKSNSKNIINIYYRTSRATDLCFGDFMFG